MDVFFLERFKGQNGSPLRCPGRGPVWPLWDRFSTELLRHLSCQPLQALYRRTYLGWIWQTQNSSLSPTEDPKCETHSKKTCEVQCKDCNVFLCCHCLASEQHNKEHTLSNIKDVFSKKKYRIKRDKEEINKQFWPAYNDIKSELENQIEYLDVDYKELSSEMAKHPEELHQEIDNAIVMNLSGTVIPTIVI